MDKLVEYLIKEVEKQASDEEFLDKVVDGTYTLNSDGSYDVVGNVKVFKTQSTFIFVKFRKVSGNFICSYNDLTTLEGAPKEVGGNFICKNNNLTTLEGAPEIVDEDFYCNNNNLTTLEGAPKEVGGNFTCSYNDLTTLEGAPKEVGGNFTCKNNYLTTLEGAPKEVGGNFTCKNNDLTTLEGLNYVKGKIIYNNNPMNCEEEIKKHKQRKASLRDI